MQTLLQFFHAEGNGLTIEDMKNPDHKVCDAEKPFPRELSPGKQQQGLRWHRFFFALICVLSFWLAFNPLLFPPLPGPGRGAEDEQVLVLRVDRAVLPGEDLPAGNPALGHSSIDPRGSPVLEL